MTPAHSGLAPVVYASTYAWIASSSAAGSPESTNWSFLIRPSRAKSRARRGADPGSAISDLTSRSAVSVASISISPVTACSQSSPACSGPAIRAGRVGQPEERVEAPGRLQELAGRDRLARVAPAAEVREQLVHGVVDLVGPASI